MANWKLIFVILFSIIGYVLTCNPCEGTTTLVAHAFDPIIFAKAPFKISYVIDVVGGSSNGLIDVVFVDEENYQKLQNGDYFQWISGASQLSTAYASVSDYNVEGESLYYLVAWNENVVLSVDVQYQASVTTSDVSNTLSWFYILLIGNFFLKCISTLIFSLRWRRLRAMHWSLC
jgi:hypothetical protein